MFPRTVKRVVWDHQPIFIREVADGVFIGVVLYCVNEDAPDFEVGLRNCCGWKETPAVGSALLAEKAILGYVKELMIRENPEQGHEWQ